MKKFLYILSSIALFFLISLNANAAGTSLYFSPSSGTFYAEKNFNVSILVNTNGQNINAIKTNLKFDPEILQIVKTGTGESFTPIWASPPSYSNQAGTLSFQGGVPSPGISTSSGSVLKITFKAIKTGETTISILDSSMVLLDDGNGTDTLNSLGTAKYTIISQDSPIVLPLPPETLIKKPNVSSSTHPDQNQWYNNNDIILSWDNDSEVSNFSYSLDRNPQGVPDQEIGNKTSASFSYFEDGIYYFHIRGEKDGEYGEITNYAIRIDSNGPTSFEIEANPSAITTSFEPIFSFSAIDEYSGIDYYETKITNAENGEQIQNFIKTDSPYQTPTLETGKYLFTVKAYDKVGNSEEESIEIEIISEDLEIEEEDTWIQGFLFPWYLMIILIIITVFALIMWIKERKKE